MITGSGAAGLSLALRLANRHQVTILSRGPVAEGSTFYARGDTAAVFGETDSIDPHVEDTLITGASICDRHTVELVANNARSCMWWLIDQGMLFGTHTQPNGEGDYHLVREGGHSRRRVLHAADATGREVETTLVSKALNHPNIRVLKRSNAIDLIVSDKIGLPDTRRVVGTWVWNRNKGTVETCHTKAVMLATGGTSKVYQHTTNPDISSDDGIVTAWRTGYRVVNLEFNQFHPITLYHPQTRDFLLTEALCGEGAYLRRPDGTRPMPDFDKRSELALCDTVTRAIDHEMKCFDADCVFLDISHKPADSIRQYFPMIYEKLLRLGINLTWEPVPIIPAAHYTRGGVMVDDRGRTDAEGLYAIGEASCTSSHGANRITSNSLPKCLVYDWPAAEDITRHIPYAHDISTLPPWDENRVEDPDERVVIQHNWHELRLFMWDYAGIVRITKRPEHTLRRIIMLQQKINEYHAHFHISDNLLELRSLTQVAELIVRCAMMCKESWGLRFTLDYPELLTHSGPPVFSPGNHYINR